MSLSGADWLINIVKQNTLVFERKFPSRSFWGIVHLAYGVGVEKLRLMWTFRGRDDPTSFSIWHLVDINKL